MSYATTDLSDKYTDVVQIADPIFRDFGGNIDFYGPVKTLKLFEDNSLVRASLEQPGGGRVLVVDGGASMRCALVGDQLGELAVNNGWAGILVYGCIRDSAVIAMQAVGVKAMNTHPRKSLKKGVGEEDLTVSFAGVTIAPGDWVYADADGVAVSREELAPA
ncbi:MAG: ribonuclease E activity regulator RraA [Oceanococcus sp.]